MPANGLDRQPFSATVKFHIIRDAGLLSWALKKAYSLWILTNPFELKWRTMHPFKIYIIGVGSGLLLAGYIVLTWNAHEYF